MRITQGRPWLLAAAAIGLAMFIAGGAWSLRTARAADVPVTVQNFAFNPFTQTVNVGDTVTWTNMDGVPHTASSDVGVSPAFDTGTISPGGSATVTFTQAGTFAYHCNIYAGINGTIVVAAGQSPTATSTTPATATTTTATATVTGTATATATATVTATTTATATATVQPSGQCALTVAGQTVAPSTTSVVVPLARQSRTGYLVIHESSASGLPGPVIGAVSLVTGADNVNVAVPLSRAVVNGETLWAMLHTEDNGNTTYDSEALDKPTVDAACGNPALGNIVTFPMVMTVEAVAGASPAPATPAGTATVAATQPAAAVATVAGAAPGAPSTGSGLTSGGGDGRAGWLLMGAGTALALSALTGLAVRRRRADPGQGRS